MQNMNNALRLGTFISQLEAGRSEQVAAMVVEATLPYGHLDDDWPGRGGREVGKLSRALAKAANPTRGLSEAQLLELFQDTFAPSTRPSPAPRPCNRKHLWRSGPGGRTWRGRATLRSTSRSSSLGKGCSCSHDLRQGPPAEEPAKGLDPAAVEAWVVASRARQGLGPKITDPATLASIAVLAHIHDKQRRGL